MRTTPLKFLLVISLIGPALGCTPSLEQWVKDRGYNYHKDYSTLNPLGRIVESNGALTANPLLRVAEEVKGDLPDVSEKKNVNFKVEGGANVTKFLTGIADGDIQGEFEIAHAAEVAVAQPFVLEATTLVPIGVCDNEKMEIATKVPNTGVMTITVRDSAKNDISTRFGPKSMGASGKIGTEFGKTIKATGRNFFVGYYHNWYRCSSLSRKEDLIIKKGEVTSFGGVDFYYARFIEQEQGTLPVADVYISPSAFYVNTGRVRELFAASVKLGKAIAKVDRDERLKPVEDQILQLASMPDQLKYLQARLAEQEERSHDLDTKLHRAIQKGSPFWEEWGSLREKEGAVVLHGKHPLRLLPGVVIPPVEGKQAAALEDVRMGLHEKSKIVDEKELILARVTRSESQVLTTASNYKLTFGSHLSLPGQTLRSGVYLEVIDVEPGSLRVRIDHISIKPVGPE